MYSSFWLWLRSPYYFEINSTGTEKNMIRGYHWHLLAINNPQSVSWSLIKHWTLLIRKTLLLMFCIPVVHWWEKQQLISPPPLQLFCILINDEKNNSCLWLLSSTATCSHVSSVRKTTGVCGHLHWLQSADLISTAGGKADGSGGWLTHRLITIRHLSPSVLQHQRPLIAPLHSVSHTHTNTHIHLITHTYIHTHTHTHT